MSHSITLDELFTKFWRESVVQGTTKRACRSAWNWLMAYRGKDCLAGAVTNADIAGLQVYLRDEALSRFGTHFPAKSIFDYTTSIGQVFRFGVKRGYVPANPLRELDRTDRIRPPKKTVHVYADDELVDLLDTVRGNPDREIRPIRWDDPTGTLRWTGFILCGLHCMREGEIWNLRRDLDIDLDAGVIRIQSRRDKPGHWWTWDAKTANDREVPMNDELWAVMSRLCQVAPWTYPFLTQVACERKQAQIGNLTETQRKYTYNGFHRAWHRILRDTNLRRKRQEKPLIESGRFHTLRKNGATHLTEEGMAEVHIQRILGHATDRMTKEIYTFVNDRKALVIGRAALNRLPCSQ